MEKIQGAPVYFAALNTAEGFRSYFSEIFGALHKLYIIKGGPGTGSYYMCYMLYQQAFKSHKYGYGSAVAVILFILIAIFTAILFATSKGWIFYEGDDRE